LAKPLFDAWLQTGTTLSLVPNPEMPMFSFTPTARVRPSPFFEAAVAEGMVTANVYNRMIMPTSFGNPEAEYWRLINGVSQWDVGVERQVQLKGPDAGKLAQILSPRDLTTCKVGQGKYVPLCNHKGVLINDPILLKLADDLYWFSIADSDIWYWAGAIAAERGLKVEISEPDVSPMALQGPKAEDVVAHVVGDWVRALKYFWFNETEIDGIPVAVQRSGWSKQGGFEIYLRDGTKGTKLWNIFKEAGKAWGIGPGAPATPERVESGLVSVGGDTDDQTNPFEVRLGKYVDLEVPDDVVGIQALCQIKATGIRRHQLGVILEGSTPAPLGFRQEEISYKGAFIGKMTNCVWSPRLKANIGFALISSSVQTGGSVLVHRPNGPVAAELVELPFL
jgi:glycine cleavage system aminomethyltransferase T